MAGRLWLLFNVTAQHNHIPVQSVLRVKVPKSASKSLWLVWTTQLDLLGPRQSIKQMLAQPMFERTSATLNTNLNICKCGRLVRFVAADSDSGDMRPTPASSSTSVQSFFVRESHAIMVE
jgi:hypothetical protein